MVLNAWTFPKASRTTTCFVHPPFHEPARPKAQSLRVCGGICPQELVFLVEVQIHVDHPSFELVSPKGNV